MFRSVKAIAAAMVLSMSGAAWANMAPPPPPTQPNPPRQAKPAPESTRIRFGLSGVAISGALLATGFYLARKGRGR